MGTMTHYALRRNELFIATTVGVDTQVTTGAGDKEPIVKYGHATLKRGDVFQGQDGIKYTVEEEIHFGGFGDIYKVRAPNEQYYALRTELSTMRKELKEQAVHQGLMSRLNDKHIIRLFSTGSLVKEDVKFRVIVCDLVGPNLAQVRKYLLRDNFSESTGMVVAHKSFSALCTLHAMNILHRNITPSAFCIGPDPRRTITVSLVSYGAAVRKGKLPSYFNHNTTYCARKAHTSPHKMTRKDDLESWIYTMMDLFDDKALPWKSKRNDVLPMASVLSFKNELMKKGKDAEFAEQIFNLVPELFHDVIFEHQHRPLQLHKNIHQILRKGGAEKPNVVPDWAGMDLIMPWPIRPEKETIEHADVDNFIKLCMAAKLKSGRETKSTTASKNDEGDEDEGATNMTNMNMTQTQNTPSNITQTMTGVTKSKKKKLPPKSSGIGKGKGTGTTTAGESKEKDKEEDENNEYEELEKTKDGKKKVKTKEPMKSKERVVKKKPSSQKKDVDEKGKCKEKEKEEEDNEELEKTKDGKKKTVKKDVAKSKERIVKKPQVSVKKDPEPEEKEKDKEKEKEKEDEEKDGDYEDLEKNKDGKKKVAAKAKEPMKSKERVVKKKAQSSVKKDPEQEPKKEKTNTVKTKTGSREQDDDKEGEYDNLGPKGEPVDNAASSAKKDLPKKEKEKDGEKDSDAKAKKK